MRTTIELINHIIKAKKYKRYLEIRSFFGHPSASNEIVCDYKQRVYADTERLKGFVDDEFRVYDIIYIDLLYDDDHKIYTAFIASMNHLSYNGIIVIHGGNTETERRTTYELIGTLRANFVTLPFNEGDTVVKRGPYIFNDDITLTWDEFQARRTHWLKIVNETQFEDWLLNS